MFDSTPFRLDGKIALVTGASRGIGRAIAEAYAAAGARLVLASRKQEALDGVAQEIRLQGGEAIAVAAHTGDPAAVQHLVDETVKAYGGVDVLVNNAGTNPHFGPILTSEESHWDKTFDINVKGYYRLARLCVESMRLRGGGKIINMASIAGKTPLPGMGLYCVTKAAVIMLTEVLAVELASENIQVNAIAPGFVKTRFSRVLWETPDVYASVVKAIPQGRMAEPQEITGIALYLASEASNFTTGASFLIDGGQLAGRGMAL